MNRAARLAAAWLRAAATSMLIGAMSAGAAQAIEVVDDAGRRVALDAPARRVIALGPHLTELVYAAGGGDRLVGVLRYSDHPPEARRLPAVGDAYALNFETIARLKPDLVLLWSSGVNDRHKTQLRSMNLTVFESEIRDVAGIAGTLRRLGTLLDSQPVAERAARDTEAQWAALGKRYANRRPVRVFYQLWHDPLMTLNGEHVISRAIEACGGVNPFATLPGLTPTISWEAAVRANPQVIVTADSKDEPPHLGRWRHFTEVEAVQRNRFAVLDGSLIARMGPRFVLGAAALCEAIDNARSTIGP
jgi:iron complex transport system substrate-binding protein